MFNLKLTTIYDLLLIYNNWKTIPTVAMSISNSVGSSPVGFIIFEVAMLVVDLQKQVTIKSHNIKSFQTSNNNL